MTVRTKPPTAVPIHPASKKNGKRSIAKSTSTSTATPRSTGSNGDTHRSSKPSLKISSRSPRSSPRGSAANRSKAKPVKPAKPVVVSDHGPVRGTKYTTTRVRTNGDGGNSVLLTEISRPSGAERPITEAVRRASNNLLDEMGGVSGVLSILDESDHPNAPRLADLLRSNVPDIAERPFGRKILDAGMKPETLAELLYDRQKTRAFVSASMDIPEVIAGIVRRAKDRFKRCTDCQGGGRKLTDDQRKNQLAANNDAPVCLPCEGVGWILVSGEMEAVELYLELVRLRKSGQQIYNDFSRKSLQQNQISNSNVILGGPNGSGDGQPPSIDTIIKRADEQRYLPSTSASASAPAPVTSQPIEAELMPEEVVREE